MRRPEKQYGINYSKEFTKSLIGPFEITYDYRHVGKVEDWKNGSVRAKVDSSDIMNFTLSKDLYGSIWSLNLI